ncbi:MAG TPA: DUF2127 domain-containing protein [Candidatus Saccharimonadia bacterium]|jgi:uncharacterized membrane protein
MAWFKPHNLLDRTFEIGIILKGIDGVVEVIGGLLLLVVPASLINSLAVSLTRGELSDDPHDFIATHLLRTAHGLTGTGLWYGALYLLSHGILKIVIVWALLRNKLWAYPWAIAFLLVFIVYQTYRVALDHSLGLTGLTIFDILVVWLTYREWNQQRARLNVTDK